MRHCLQVGRLGQVLLDGASLPLLLDVVECFLIYFEELLAHLLFVCDALCNFYEVDLLIIGVQQVSRCSCFPIMLEGRMQTCVDFLLIGVPLAR